MVYIATFDQCPEFGSSRTWWQHWFAFLCSMSYQNKHQVFFPTDALLTIDPSKDGWQFKNSFIQVFGVNNISSVLSWFLMIWTFHIICRMRVLILISWFIEHWNTVCMSWYLCHADTDSCLYLILGYLCSHISLKIYCSFFKLWQA